MDEPVRSLPQQGPSTLLRAFDLVCLINLPERSDRLRDSMEQLRGVDADADHLVTVVPGVRADAAHGFPSPQVYGCFQAHLAALQLAQDKGAGSVLVLEDDLHFNREFFEKWSAVDVALEQVPWDVVSLGFDPARNLPEKSATTPLFPTTGEMQLTHCYGLSSPRAITSLIDYLHLLAGREVGDPRGGPMDYDGALYHFIVEHPDMKRYRTARSLVVQRSSRSDIFGERWFDRDVLFLRPAVTWLRRQRNRLRS